MRLAGQTGKKTELWQQGYMHLMATTEAKAIVGESAIASQPKAIASAGASSSTYASLGNVVTFRSCPERQSQRHNTCLQVLPELLNNAAELCHLPAVLAGNSLVHGCHLLLLIKLALQSLLSQRAAVLFFFDQELLVLQ